jgi:hypothetical protein
VPTQNTNPEQVQIHADGGQQQQHVVASPNPTVDDSKTPATQIPKVEVKGIQPAQSTTAAPMKPTTHGKHKSKKHGSGKKKSP